MEKLKGMLDSKRIPLFLCIGTMNNTLDSIAPRIGFILQNKGYNVIGTSEAPLHGMNIKERYSTEILHFQTHMYQHIAIDACMLIGESKDDEFAVHNRPCRPGSGIGHKLPELGEILIECNSFKYAKERDSKILTTWGIMVHNHGDMEVESRLNEMAERFVKELQDILKGE